MTEPPSTQSTQSALAWPYRSYPMVRRDMDGVSTLEDLQSKKMQVGAQRGTTAYFFLENRPGLRPIGQDGTGRSAGNPPL